MWLCIFSTATIDAHPATGIVVDSIGNIYFSDLETIWKLDAQGTLTVLRARERGRHVHELFIDEQDNIYGGDVSYNAATEGWISDIWKINPQNKFTYLLEPTTNPPPGWGILRDHAGNMYSVEQNNHTKTQTLILRRTPDGVVKTLAGGTFGHADGRGKLAKFSSIGGIAFGKDGQLYVTDGAFVRTVAMDGTVTTLAGNLLFRTPEDRPRLFAGGDAGLAGLATDDAGNVYVADSGNRRLLKVSKEGQVQVVFRSEPPYFPTGVAKSGPNLYVLEVGLTLPNASSGPRIQRIENGKATILATVGSGGSSSDPGKSFAIQAGVAAESTLALLVNEGRLKYTLAVITAVLVSLSVLIWQHRRRSRA